MTCIVGIRTAAGVLLAGDTLGVGRGTKQVRSDEKVFACSERVAIGFTTSYRMGQILRFHLELPSLYRPDLSALMDEYEWAVTRFVPAARAALSTHRYTYVTNEREAAGVFLLAVRNRLFKVDSDFQVGEHELAYDACGSGEDFALGALYAERSSATVPRARARLAIEAAATFATGVGGPITFVETAL